MPKISYVIPLKIPLFWVKRGEGKKEVKDTFL
jgi:hypothetical protein